MNIIKDEDFRDYMAQSQRQSIRPASDFVDEAMEILVNGVNSVGDKLPWPKTHDLFRFREGELTIWAGVNGNGKSLVMGQTALWLMRHTPVLIASCHQKLNIPSHSPLRCLLQKIKPSASVSLKGSPL